MLNKKRFNFQLVLAEFLIFIFMLLVFLFVNKALFFKDGFIDTKNSMVSYSLLFVFIIIGLGMSLYYDYRYNNLKFKNIFLYIGFGIALIGSINSLILPDTVSLINNSTMNVTVSQRLYGVFYSIMLGLLPYLFLYAAPRKLRFKKYIELVIFSFIAVVLLSFVISVFLDFNKYIITLKSGFSDLSNPITSFYPHKNIYARILFVGICSVIYMDIYSNKHLWLLLLIPFTFSLILTIAKMPIVLGFLIIIFYLLYRLINYVKNNKDNLTIFYLICGFVVCLTTVISILICFSQSGILLKIKNLFISIGQNAKNTFNSRLIIWDCTLKLLKPIQYIFGFGYTLVGYAIHIVYTNDPRCPEETSHIWTAHNSVLEIIAEGGIVYLLINIFILVYIIYASVKIYKKNKTLCVTNLFVIFLVLIQGITDSIMFFSEGDNVFITVLIAIPVLAEYYRNYYKPEIENRKAIVSRAYEIKNVDFKSKFINFNKKLLIIKSKFIKQDKTNLTKIG